MDTVMQNIAPLLRGLYVQNAGRSVIVLHDDKVVDAECTINLELAFQEGSFNEKLGAKIASETCAAWLFEHSPSGVAALQQQGSPKVLPSCINVHAPEGIRTFWVDWDLDSCRNRMLSKNQEPLSVSPMGRESYLDRSSAVGEAQTYDFLFQNRMRIAEGKIALVTGGAQGFGEELVLGLVGAGALVFIADLNYEGAQGLANRLNKQYGRTVALPAACNVADESSVKDLFIQVARQTGGLDICVSNAGVLRAGSVLDQDLASFKLVTDVNYTAFFLVVKYAAPLMRLQALTAPDWYADIIQINSKSGLEGSNKNGAYAGSKFGGIGLVQSFAMELVEYRIKVNAICPGNFFDGPLWSDPQKGLFVQYLQAGKVPGAKTVADVRAFYEAKVPMKRGCTGPDVLRALFYIIEQVYETGQALPVTGGQVMLH